MTRPASLRKMLPGRRLGDPVQLVVDPNIRAVRGRLAAVSVRASIGAGAWVGFALGLVVGMLLGAALVWFAGAVLDWQRDLAFTFGVARRLLPFGDQLGLLRDLQARWWIVVPLAGFTVAALGLFVGGLLGGILGAAYNRSPRHALVVVELPRQVAPPFATPTQSVAPSSSIAVPSSSIAAPSPEPAAVARQPADRNRRRSELGTNRSERTSASRPAGPSKTPNASRKGARKPRAESPGTAPPGT
jgi:hypothetical protein